MLYLNYRYYWLFIGLGYLYPMTTYAVLEDIQVGLSQPYEFPLRWDNVKEPPLWVKGIAPESSQDWGMSQVTLEEPGDFVTVWLAEGQWLRIYNPDKALPVEALEIAVSYGTGLYADVPVYSAQEGHSLLLTPNLSQSRLVCIRLAPQQEAVTMALFTSRYENIYPTVPQQTAIPLSTNPVTLRFGYQIEGEQSIEKDFWYLQAHTSTHLTVEGPVQLSLETRFIYPQTEVVLQQAYRVLVQIDDNTQFLEFETTVDNQQPIMINGQPQVLGRSEMTYLQLPEGEHDLQIHSNANLLVRLVSQEPVAQTEFLFPKLNQPPYEIFNGENRLPTWINKSSWQLTEPEIQSLYLTHFDSVEAIRHVALRLIRDNSRREGGLLGAMAMREAARRRPYEAKVRRLANGLLGRHSFYRNLLPWHKQHNDSQKFYRFLVYQLRTPDSKFRPLVVANQHQESYLKRIAGAYFAPLSNVFATEAQIYKLPKRTVPSLLQVAVKQQTQPQAQTFFLQFDNETPIRMQVEPYVFEAPSHYYRYAQGEAGLKMLALAHGTDADTLGGPFASQRLSGALIDASHFVLPLPPQVRQIKLWQTEVGTEPLYVALQYRATRRHYRLSETEYLEAISQFESPETLFNYFVTVLRTYTPPEKWCSDKNLQGLVNLEGLTCNFSGQLYQGDKVTTLPSKNDAQRDLYNYWLPFIRFLYAQRQHFLATVYRSSQPEFQIQLVPENELKRLITQAQQAETDKQWLVALEKWTQIARGSQGTLHRQAQFAREESLEQLGEIFLAKRLLQGLFGSEQPNVAQNAFEKLLFDYQQWDNKAAQLPLLATAVLNNPTPALFKQLIQALIENGYQDYAFKVGMAMPHSQRDNTLMIEQAYRFRWWQTFEQLLRYLPETTQRLWLGYRAQAKGDYATALQFWQETDLEETQKLATALEQGLQIRHQLQNQSIPNSQRKQAIQNWERWQAEHPGPRYWINAENMVSDYASGELIYNIERDLYFYAFVSTPQRPVKIRIPGPKRIRLQVRTLHDPDEVQPVDSWVHIKELGNSPKLQVLRLNNILPSRGLRIVGQSDKLLGHLTYEEYELGPGLHELEVFSRERAIVVKVMSEEPRLPLSVLPPLDQDTLTVAMMLQDADLTENATCQWISSNYPDRGEYATGSVEPNILRERTDIMASNDESRFSQCRRAISLPDCQCLDCVMLIPQCLTFTSYNQYVKRDASFILEHLYKWQSRENTLLNPLSRGNLEVAKYLAAENYEIALAVPFENDESGVLKRMNLLLWIAEQAPELAQKAVVAGAELFHSHHKMAKLRPLWSALRANHHWKSLQQSIESSAGLHFVKIKGWQPESPSQRIRKTLLKPVGEDEQVITGHRRMGLSVFNLAPTTLELKFTMDDVAYFRPVPMNVVYWLDEQAHQRLQLTPEQSHQTRRFTIPEGEHILYVAIEKPVANQFLRLQVKEMERGNALLLLEYERAYHIATPEEPVIINVLGPTWLRVDEWHPDHTYSYFHRVNQGWQKLTFAPKNGQSSALLRFHELAPVNELEPQPPEVQLRYFSREPDVMPEPLVHIYKLPPIARLDVKDAFPLGEQEEGTWSLTGLVQRRRNVEEEESGFQDFLELRATHRYFDEINHRHHRTEGLVRFNDHWDTVFGIRKRLRSRSEEHNLTVQIAGSAYMQQLRDNGREWHGLLKGTLSQRWLLSDKTVNIPSISLFGRLLSLDDAPDDYATRLDNDVYSDYKADHRYGITIADQIRHRPWLDTLWTGRIALTSNENFLDPDYLSFKGVWKQMLGEGQIDLGYRFIHYWADEDRNKNSDRHFLLLNLNWNIWRNNQTRWELGAKLQQDLDNDELLGMLYISWHGGKGRAYRDFMPGEIDFLNLRKRRVPQKENNEIIRFW